MSKTWIEHSIYTDSQIAIVAPNEIMDGVVLRTIEKEPKAVEVDRLYLTYQEAKYLGNQLLNFEKSNE